MKILDLLILIVLFVLLGIGIYFLWTNLPLPAEPVSFEEYKVNLKEIRNFSKFQFYPNMRYRNEIISYSISESCDEAKKKDVERAFNFIAEKTVLKFYNKARGEIDVLCSNITPKPEERGHFVAGEGGPSEIINTTNYAVILSGKVSLYRRFRECVKPIIAIHEILHALGFDHNSNSNSIMYPVAECGQEFDNYIIDEINRLYSVDSAQDLVIEKISAKKSGSYLNFEITVGNFGLKDSDSSSLLVSTNGEEIREFELNKTEIGTRKILQVENLKIPRNTNILNFEVLSNERELNLTNNKVEIGIGEKQ